MRRQLFAVPCAMLAVYALLDTCPPEAKAGGEFDSKVKATVKAGKIGADSKQTLTITLEMEKGWYIYANPVGDDEYKQNRTLVTVKAKEKVTADVTYPVGKVKVIEGKSLKIYPDRTELPVVVQRTVGDTSALEVSIEINACDANNCLPTRTIKVTVP